MDFLPYPVSKIGYKKTQPDVKVLETRQQLEEVMDVMRSNILKLAERGDRLENLASRAEVLDMTTAGYDHSSQSMKVPELKSNLHKIVLVIFGLVCFICGIFLFK